MSVATMDEIEDALHAWVMSASGYAADKVLWDSQDTPRPADDFILLKLTTQDTDGAFDALEVMDADMGQPLGQEVELRVTGWRSFFLHVEAFTRATHGESAGFQVCTHLQATLALDSAREALAVVGVAPTFDRGTVQNIPTVIGTSRFEGRAFVEIGFCRAVEVSDRVGFIEETTGTGTLDGPSVSGPVPVDFDADAG